MALKQRHGRDKMTANGKTAAVNFRRKLNGTKETEDCEFSVFKIQQLLRGVRKNKKCVSDKKRCLIAFSTVQLLIFWWTWSEFSRLHNSFPSVFASPDTFPAYVTVWKSRHVNPSQASSVKTRSITRTRQRTRFTRVLKTMEIKGQLLAFSCHYKDTVVKNSCKVAVIEARVQGGFPAMF